MELRLKLLTELSFFWGTVSLIALLIAWKKGFFHLISWQNEIKLNIRHVLCAFIIYLLTILVITPVFLKFINITHNTSSVLGYVSISNISSFFLTLLFLSIYYCKNFKFFESNIALFNKEIAENIKAALICWAIVTPLVLFFSQISDLIITKNFKFEKIPDQNAVNYFKMSLKSPIYFSMAFFTIVFLAPIVEEILFRGFLQTWLKKHLNVFLSMLITALTFTFFHFSITQKIGNVVILSALFPLAFFLSFIYEKQKTLICPIFLHAIFNFSSILSLMLIGE